MSCDGYVLEPGKAEGDGSDVAAKRIRSGWTFHEKNEFCARWVSTSSLEVFCMGEDMK
jgi:hypothetical protein